MGSREVQSAYSSFAQDYIDRLGSVDVVHPDDLALIQEHLGRRVGPVLDLGCGPGHLTGFLHAGGCDVSGIDLVPEFLAHARRVHPEVSFERGSLIDLPHPDASVVGVLAWYSLIHLGPDDLDAALREIRRVVAPGGALVVGFVEGEVCEPFDHTVVTAYRWTAAELLRRLASSGFVQVEHLRRGLESERRPHLAIAARAVPTAAARVADGLRSR